MSKVLLGLTFRNRTSKSELFHYKEVFLFSLLSFKNIPQKLVKNGLKIQYFSEN